MHGDSLACTRLTAALSVEGRRGAANDPGTIDEELGIPTVYTGAANSRDFTLSDGRSARR